MTPISNGVYSLGEETDKDLIYIEKWIKRNGFIIHSSSVDYIVINDNKYDSIIRYQVKKYGVYRTLEVIRNKRERKIYLDLFNKYYEALREIRELKEKGQG